MTRYALVVGITDYDGLPSLLKPIRDAEAVAQRLEKHGDFQVDRLPKQWNSEKESYEVTHERVTGKQLGQALLEFFQKQAKGSEALIYFSGHGITVLDEFGQQKGYLAASDCAIAIEGKQITGQQRGLALDSLNAVIAQADLMSLVVLLDCCHADYFLEGNLVRQTLNIFTHKPDFHLIAACRGLANPSENKRYGWGHSVFTTVLLEGLLPENAGSDGQVRVNDLFRFILRKLDDRNLQSERSDYQQPICVGSGNSVTLVSYPPKPAIFSERRDDEICPYQGLHPFDWSRSRFFFGRRQVIQTLRQKLETANFVPVIGASGSGKSSAVNAGLIPSLEAANWRVLDPIFPGSEPVEELKRAFAQLLLPTDFQDVDSLIDKATNLQPAIEQLPLSERVLLVVDRFEEVFALCSQEAERSRFIQLLTRVAEIPGGQLAVVIIMRADCLEPCLHYPLLTALIQDRAVYMPPLVGSDLESAIVSPAHLAGFKLESGLSEVILQDFARSKGNLPLLQFALTKLWQNRDTRSHQLTLEQYRQIGGVTEALNQHAEKLYQSFTEQQRDWVKQIFLKLVRSTANLKDTRQRQPKSQLLAIAADPSTDCDAYGDLLDYLEQEGLLVSSQKPDSEIWLDLAHEVLIEGWHRFAQWRQSG